MAKPDPPASLRPLLALAGGAAAIGCAPVLVRWSETGQNATAFWRLALALPLLWWWTRRRGEPALPREGRGWLWLAGACFGLQVCFWHGAIAWTTVANATLLANLTPLFVVGWCWLALGRRPTGAFAAGMLLALAGAGGLALGGVAGPGQTGPEQLAGDALGVLTGGWYAAYLLLIERSRREASGAQAALASTAAASLVAAVAMLALDTRWWPRSAEGWAVLLLLGVVVQAAGQGSIAWAVGRLPATLSSVVILVQVLVAAALGWALLGEPLTAAAGGYAALLLAGVLLCRRGAGAG